VSCQRGDVFCRECALANILSQKKELKRADKARQLAEEDDARRRGELEAEERERAVRDFELTQAGIDVAQGRKVKGEEQADSIKGDGGEGKREMKLLEGAPSDETKEQHGKNGGGLVKVDGESAKKRKFELDPEDLNKAAQEDRSKARKAIDEEKVCFPFPAAAYCTPSQPLMQIH
jgi:nitric oxide synthase-interacting protein